MAKKGKTRGKPPVGRAGQRGKAHKSSPSSNGWQHPEDFRFGFGNDNEPRNTFRGFSQRGPPGSQQGTPNAKLRHQAIAFISAAPSVSVGEGAERSFMQEAIAVAAGESESEEEDEDDEDLDDSSILTNILLDTEMEISEEAMAHMDLQGTAEPTASEANGRTFAQAMNGDAPSFEPRAPDFQLFFVDTTGDPDVQPGRRANGKRPVARSPSPAKSDSSEEVILFSGRNGKGRPTVVDDPVFQRSQTSAQQSRPTNGRSNKPTQAPHLTDALLAALGAPSPYEEKPKGWAARPPRHQIEAEAASTDWVAAPAIPYWKKGKGSGKPRPDLDLRAAEKMELDAAPPRQTRVMFAEPETEPKIQQAPEEAEEREDERTLVAELQAELRRTFKGKRPAKDVKARHKRPSKDTGYIGLSGRQQMKVIVNGEEDDDEAAYDDYMANLAAQMDAEDGEIAAFAASKSELISGPSLVVDGKEITEDEVLKHEDEWEDSDASNSDEPIGQDLDSLSDEGLFNYSDIEQSSDLEEELENTEKQQWEDEEDLRQRRIASMGDEKYARLLNKQLELGISDEELVIDDGIFDDGGPSEEGVGDVAEAHAGLRSITNSSFGRSANKHGMRRARRTNGNDNFPDATLLADTVDQYGENGFDIMDFERPSLRPKKKGKKGKFPEADELSDDELKEQMLGAWEADREKKRLKKAEREELRSQGLLGAAGRKGKADLSQKYLEGMTMTQVHDELRIFLQNAGQASRPFPPMSKTDRAALHLVAGALNLRTKSIGTGNSRYPVVFKTPYTPEYNEVQVNKAISRSARGFLSNSSSKGKKLPRKEGWAKTKGGKGGGFDKSATGIRHGEVVGAGAKEIDQDSFGHKLLEKMGWTKGTALGRDRDGMLLPVEQVMRAGKAGLG
ncbi:hypothetical protein LTR08_005687 [Meristemomyces frigidus]|nr:hypothetical protein LTR08_005687 [Meristemomyces frigidus]